MRILVIEDEPRILDFLRLGLEAEGFVVDGAEDGAAGLAPRARRSRTNSSSSTCCCRGSTGSGSSRELRRAAAELPVLILSARSDLPTKLRGFELGANDYLAKPFSFDELVARVRVHVRRGRDATAHDAPRGRGASSTSRAAAAGRRRVVDLSDREFRLLYHLVSHAGEVVSRERLLSEVWGYGFDPARTSSTSASGGCARSSAAPSDRDGAPCRLSRGGGLTRVELGWGVLAVACLGVDGRLAVLGDDPVPRHLDQPDAALRLPRVVAADDGVVLGASCSRPARRSCPTPSTGSSSGASSSRFR